MRTTEQLKEQLIQKILKIKSIDVLESINTILSSSKTELKDDELTMEQKTMLDMSISDIEAGKLISQDAMKKRNLEWLDSM